MKSKREPSVVDKKFTFFASPLANLENKMTVENTIKEPRLIVYNNHFGFLDLVDPNHPTVDNEGMDNDLLSFEHLNPGDELQKREAPNRPYTRNFEDEMRIVDHYMKM